MWAGVAVLKKNTPESGSSSSWSSSWAGSPGDGRVAGLSEISISGLGFRISLLL